ncbi:MAG: hypothetical protein AAF264_00200 [Pseudomonadota bacterium]
MTTLLQLCRDVNSESGTGKATQPITAVDQTGRLGKVVRWVKDAYRDIERRSADWRWMQDEFTATLVVGQGRYDGAADFGLTRLAQFKLGRAFPLTVSEVGTDHIGIVRPVFWDDFVARGLLGRPGDTGQPQIASIDNAGRLALYPTPDKAYAISGSYRKGPQPLVADADVPEMPERFHDLIRYEALILLAKHDEAISQLPLWIDNQRRIYAALVREERPEVSYPPTFA